MSHNNLVRRRIFDDFYFAFGTALMWFCAVFDVGRLTDLGMIFPETAKKILAPYWRRVGAAYGRVFDSESTAMMIYYCQGTGGSLRSSWELQESILLTLRVTRKWNRRQSALLDLKTPSKILHSKNITNFLACGIKVLLIDSGLCGTAFFQASRLQNYRLKSSIGL